MTSFNITRAFLSLADRVQSMRAQVRTERVLNSLPAELRKDIGWPDRFDDRGPFRR